MKDLLNKITNNIARDDDPTSLNDPYGNNSPSSFWEDEEDVDFSEENIDKAMAVDVYQDEHNLYIKAFVPGIDPEKIDIDITRDMITLKGNSFRDSSTDDSSYFQQELVWGSFARTISLPREIDIELAQARADNGILHITLPKLDKDRRTKLRVD